MPSFFVKKRCKKIQWLPGLILLLLPVITQAQVSYNFHHLTNSDGLSNGTIRAIAQDKYGFIWIGTINGLNVYNGYTVKNYTAGDAPGDLPAITISALYCDDQGTMWVGTRKGLCYYNYDRGNFSVFKSDSIIVYDIDAADTSHLWIATSKGVFLLDKKTKKMMFCPSGELSHVRVNDIFSHANGNSYFACSDGLRIYNVRTGYYRYISFGPFIKDNLVQSVCVDKKENIWMGIGSQSTRFIKLAADQKTIDTLPELRRPGNEVSNTTITSIIEDKNGTTWLSTTSRGLVHYHNSSNTYTFYSYNAALPNSASSDNIKSLFVDKDGGIWLGTEGYGIDWFYPQKQFFGNIQTTLTKEETLPYNWCRAVTQDSADNLWLGTAKGLSCYNMETEKFSNYINQPGKVIFYSNSIRSLATDKKGFVWIGTGSGLNRYDPKTKRFEFFGESKGIPGIFVWFLYLDHQGRVWAGGNQGIYRWNEEKERFDNFEEDPLLQKFTGRVFRTMLQDSKGRYWFGVDGALMYDPGKKVAKHYVPQPGSVSLADETVFSIAEDKEGLIWMGTANGLSSFNPAKEQFSNYTKKDGLPSNETSSLLVDGLGRLWMGTANGLCVFDKRRNSFTSFDVNDGLCSNQFNEQSACRISNGIFIYPTYKGYVLFMPEHIHLKKLDIPVFASSFNVLGKNFQTQSNVEELKQLKLKYNQNFFSIELVSPYYTNADHVWYAYKLDGFDNDWQYTHNRMANYTNVPGGNYVFRYKASIDANNWKVPERTIAIHIGNVYYKTAWFWLILVVVVLAALTWFYQGRKQKKEKLLNLEAKAQRLEKEKALVQYESLKQQLNPHFLFNSLTSLRSLIRIDKHQAADFLDKMSLTYRYILKSSERELVTLQDELQFVQTYIDLQKTRFCEGLQVRVAIDESGLGKKIVPVTIQNLIENAIKHNLIDEDEPLIIDVSVTDNYLVVRNNLQKKAFVDTSNKQGLKNMQSLYKYLDKRPIEIKNDDDYFIVKIPLI